MVPQPFVLHPLLNILLVAIIGGLGTFLVQSLLKRRDRMTLAWETTKKQLDDHEQRLRTIELKMGFFWNSVEEHMSSILKRPTHLEMDALLEKLKDHTITLDECYTLRRWLEEVYLEGEIPVPSQRVIAVLVLGAVNSLILEYEKAPPAPAAQDVPLLPEGEPVPRVSLRARLRQWWRHLWER